MSFSLIYWILMLVWLVSGLYASRANLKGFVGGLLLFILLLLLGWVVFGSPVHR